MSKGINVTTGLDDLKTRVSIVEQKIAPMDDFCERMAKLESGHVTINTTLTELKKYVRAHHEKQDAYMVDVKVLTESVKNLSDSVDKSVENFSSSLKWSFGISASIFGTFFVPIILFLLMRPG